MINFQDRILKNPRLLKLKNPTTGEVINWEIQDYTSDEIVQQGTIVNADALNSMQLQPLTSMDHFDTTDKVYSTRYINESNTYYTTEKTNGQRWHDGDFIYRKVIQYNVDSSTSIDLTSLNIKEIINIIPIYTDTNNKVYVGNYFSTSLNYLNVYYHTQEKTLKILGKSLFGTIKVIIEYTKNEE